MKSKLMDVIACPKCKSQLRENNKTLYCSICNKHYLIQGGVIRIQENKNYRRHISQEKMNDLLNESQKIGWRKALENLPKDLRNSIFEDATRANRANWRFNLPLNRHIRLLDIGSGWGQIPFLLTEVYDEVWSLEYIEERIDWQKIRKEQEKIENLYLVQSNVINLPFLDETFDIISMNGMLEWIGLAEMESNVRDLQLQVLSDVLRILKPGAYLYIGTKNRIGYKNFLGTLDYSGMRFTSLMPRWLANLYVRHFKKNSCWTKGSQYEYRTYTYSPLGYRKLLREVGFSNIKLYWVETDYNNPVAFAPINDSRKINFFYKQIVSGNKINKFAKLIYRAFILGGFMKLFSSHLLIYAQKEK